MSDLKPLRVLYGRIHCNLPAMWPDKGILATVLKYQLIIQRAKRFICHYLFLFERIWLSKLSGCRFQSSLEDLGHGGTSLSPGLAPILVVHRRTREHGDSISLTHSTKDQCVFVYENLITTVNPTKPWQDNLPT